MWDDLRRNAPSSHSKDALQLAVSALTARHSKIFQRRLIIFSLFHHLAISDALIDMIQMGYRDRVASIEFLLSRYSSSVLRSSNMGDCVAQANLEHHLCRDTLPDEEQHNRKVGPTDTTTTTRCLAGNCDIKWEGKPAACLPGARTKC